MIPVRIVPPEKPLGRLAFISTFTRNPLEVVPRSVYEEDFVAFGAPGTPRVWITAPSMIKAVLLDQRDAFRKTTQIRLLSPLLGKGILTSEGADWKWQRQAAAPMFRPQDLRNFVPAFVRATERLVGRWRASPGDTQPIDADMTRVTFDVISATLLPSADESVAQTVEASMRALQRSGGWDQHYAAMNAPPWMPRPGMVASWRAVARLRASVRSLLEQRRARADAPDDLMQRLIASRDPESGQSMNDGQLVDNLLTFYLAGHETTARALTWTLYLLARSPEWSQALVEEIARVTAGAGIAADHIEKLVLVHQVLKESMRLYPPVPIMSRQAVAHTTLDGRRVAPGTSVLMPIYAIHRHTKRWKDPDAFDPARFAPPQAEAINRYQYMPFGAGPRICIGMSFAMMEATAILATLLQHAAFEPAGGEEPLPVARVTLIPKGGMPLRVRLSRASASSAAA